MGVYELQVLPRIVNVAMGIKTLRPLRERVCAGLSGEVLEVGFGSGHNVPLYPPAVTRAAAIEPSDLAWRLAGDRVAASAIPVERSGLDGQRLPFPDGSFDAALSTWTLCTIPDVGAALAEIRRVLKPGGRFHFVEHGLAPDAKVQRRQHRFDPLQQRVFGGCHLNRPIATLIEAAGFEIAELDEFYAKGSPKFVGAEKLGVAVRG